MYTNRHRRQTKEGCTTTPQTRSAAEAGARPSTASTTQRRDDRLHGYGADGTTLVKAGRVRGFKIYGIRPAQVLEIRTRLRATSSEASNANRNEMDSGGTSVRSIWYR